MRLKWLVVSVLIVLGLSSSDSMAVILPKKVTVRLFSAQATRHDTLIIQGPVHIKAGPLDRYLGKERFRLQWQPSGGLRLHARKSKPIQLLGSVVRLDATNPAQGLQLGMAENRLRRYPGSVHIVKSAQGLSIYNELASHDYVAIVASSETLPDWPVEVIKAQAVLVQTRLAHRKNKVLMDSTQDQSYMGLNALRPGIREAVRSVWGYVVTYQNQPIEAFFHSACAGGTSGQDYRFRLDSAQAGWLRSRPCQYCKTSPFWKPHQVDVPIARFLQMLKVNTVPQVVATDHSGRPSRVIVGGYARSGYQLWLKIGQQLGWDKLPGTRYQITALPDAKSVRLTSTGAGHGLGLCQWGAANLAKQGWSWQRILAFYFPRTQIKASVQ